MALELKNYQKRALAALADFFDRARGARDAAAMQAAFNDARRAAMGEALRDLPYRALAQPLETVPQVCVRIPTGGGKTLLAADAIQAAARHFVGVDCPVVLWLVPSNAIRAQTRDALLAPGHPYREALLAHWPADRLRVLDIDDCAQLRPQDFAGLTLVVVATMQTLRVDKTASRAVYAYDEAFEPHFASVADAEWLERVSADDLAANPSLRALLGAAGIGRVKRSFANLLAVRRPVVVVDEAHNHTTPLSVEVLRRIRPACVIEWTATPAPDQNVLYHVSAQELKAEDMIKLPIALFPHPDWQEAVRDALLTRERLAEAARSEGDYLRPIVLLQADAVNGEVPVERLKQALLDRGIAASRIAVATGTQRELEGVDLFDPACAIDFVITVEALKEGWDCSFAYVFCTVQNIRSARDMEQLLGRVLRLPYARRRRADLLNRAYAHVCGPNTTAVASQLADRLVAMGFEELEAQSAVQLSTQDMFAPWDGTPRPPPPPPSSTLELPDDIAETVQAVLQGAAQVDAVGDGSTRVVLTGALPGAAVEALLAAVPKKAREALGRELARHQSRVQAALAPAQRGVAFGPLPRLAVPVQGEMLLLEPALLTELAEVSLATQPGDLPELQVEQDDKPWLIDIEGGQLRIEQDRAQYRLDLNAGGETVRRADVIRELDRRVRRDDVLQPDMIAWLGRVLDGLEARGLTMVWVARHMNRVADAVARRVDGLVKSQRRGAFQLCLDEGPQKARLDDHFVFAFHPEVYPARWLYQGRYRFSKHYYPLPGELDEDIGQEETACAIEIDSMDEVDFWVRNLERQPQCAFWLPTSTDRFYPDFVARLKDGRFLVVEYKGAVYFTNEDSREKRDIGAVWAAASGGRCCFVMVTDPTVAGVSVGAQLRRAIVR